MNREVRREGLIVTAIAVFAGFFFCYPSAAHAPRLLRRCIAAQMLPTFWGDLSLVLPPGAAVTLLAIRRTSVAPMSPALSVSCVPRLW